MVDWEHIGAEALTLALGVGGYLLNKGRERKRDAAARAAARKQQRDEEDERRAKELQALLDAREVSAEKTRTALKVHLEERLSPIVEALRGAATAADVAAVGARVGALEVAFAQQAQTQATAMALANKDHQHLERRVSTIEAEHNAQLGSILALEKNTGDLVREAKEEVLERIRKLEMRWEMASLPVPKGLGP